MLIFGKRCSTLLKEGNHVFLATVQGLAAAAILYLHMGLVIVSLECFGVNNANCNCHVFTPVPLLHVWYKFLREDI